VELTEAGVRLAAHARRIEAGFAQAERDVKGAQDVITLRLGVPTTIPIAWIEDFLRRQTEADDGWRVEIVEGRERDLLDRLTRGRLDAAVTIVRSDNARFKSKVLLTEGYSLALPTAHRLAHRQTIAAEELAEDTMIVRRQCELLAETSRHFTTRGVRPFFAARTFEDTRALAYVRSGAGLTIMPDGFTAPGLARIRLEDFEFTRDLGILYAGHAAQMDLAESDTLKLLALTVAARS
jgi:DNA-binding transcriptional LysR family regulator